MEIPVFDEKAVKKGTKVLDIEWITAPKGLSMKAIEFAEDFGRFLADPQWDIKFNKPKVGNDALTTSQLRNFFGEIRRIQLKGFEEHKADFFMLKPKLAYSTAKVLKNSRNNRIAKFSEALTLLISKVAESGDPKHFDNFVKFVEAVLAYHKANGGKD